MRLRLYQTPLGIVLARNIKDCRSIIALAGAPADAQVETVKRRRGIIFAVIGFIEPNTDVEVDAEKFKWMGPDERRRELVQARNLPPDYGPLFATEASKED